MRRYQIAFFIALTAAVLLGWRGWLSLVSEQVSLAADACDGAEPASKTSAHAPPSSAARRPRYPIRVNRNSFPFS